MSLLGLLKKQKKSELELPPPPPKDLSVFDIPEIRHGDEVPLPSGKSDEFPEVPEKLPELPELPYEEVSAELQPSVVEEPQPSKPEYNVVFDKTVLQAKESPVEVIHKTVSVQKTFVSLDDYNTVMSSCDVVRSKLADAESLVARINELKAEENKAVDGWLDYLDEIEKKLAQADKVLARAQL